MPATPPGIVLIALGSNKPHHRHGPPRRVIEAAVAALAAVGLEVVAASRIHITAPVGPSQRSYANAAVAVAGAPPLPELLRLLKRIEADFGRRRARRWAARVLDLDIIGAGDVVLPSRLRWRSAARGLAVPHRAAAERRFVLDPLAEVAPGWRHPVLGATVRQLRARARRPKASPAEPLAQSVEQLTFNQ